MEGKRLRKDRSSEVDTTGTSEVEKTQRVERSNANRRDLYATNLVYKNDCKTYARDYYRNNNNVVLESKLDEGLLTDPVKREIFDPFSEGTTTAKVYSTGSASEALGKSRMTLLKWQRDGILPEPRLRDASRKYLYYSASELKLIATVVAKWELKYKYLTVKNVEMVEELNSRISKYRATKV